MRTNMRGILLRASLLNCASKFSRILHATTLKYAQSNRKIIILMRVNALKCAQKYNNVNFEITRLVIVSSVNFIC